MSAAEYSHITNAKSRIEEALTAKSLGSGVRKDLRRALDELQKALNWGEDELSHGNTDD